MTSDEREAVSGAVGPASPEATDRADAVDRANAVDRADAVDRTAGGSSGAALPSRTSGPPEDTVLLRVRRGTRPQAPPDSEHVTDVLDVLTPEPTVAAADGTAADGTAADETAADGTAAVEVGGRTAGGGEGHSPAAEQPAAESPAVHREATDGQRVQASQHGDQAAADPVEPPPVPPRSPSRPAGAASEPSPAAGARILASTGRRRGTRLLVLILLVGLGFGISTSARSHSGSAGLATASQEELVRTLDTLDAEQARLSSELEDLDTSRDELAGGAGPAAALDEARQRAQELAILAGTAPAAGPGVEMVVTDPELSVHAAVIVDALQELRDAGAEAIAIGDVRVVAQTFVLDSPTGGIFVEQTPLQPPYRLLVVGDGHTLAQAMRIPGGVLDTVAEREGASASVEIRERIEISALRPLPTPRYARPAG